MKKVGIVTGGLSGIGAEITKLILSYGGSVLVADINEKLALKFLSSNKQCNYIYCDVQKYNNCKKAVNKCIDLYGRLDFLINSAGIITTNSCEETTLDEWDRIISVNLRGIFLMTKYSIPYLKQTRGSIVNIASIAGLVGFRNISAYCASKGGVIAFTRSIASELASCNVRVNCICPGTVYTPLLDQLLKQSKNRDRAKRHFLSKTLLKRAAYPYEIASLVLFLIDEKKSSYITGSVLTIDGGYTAI